MFFSLGILDGDGILENLLACSNLAERGEFVFLSFGFSLVTWNEHVRNEFSKVLESLGIYELICNVKQRYHNSSGVAFCETIDVIGEK